MKLIDVDNSAVNDIIKSSGKGKSINKSEHYYENYGEININDGKVVSSELKKFIAEEDSPIEKCRVINKSGKMYTVYGDEYTVNTGLLGDEMNGSINIHNHVTGQSQYSFSKEDLVESIRDGSYISYAYDERFLYTMIIKNKIPADLAVQLYEEARLEVDDILFHNP